MYQVQRSEISKGIERKQKLETRLVTHLNLRFLSAAALVPAPYLP